MDEILNDAANAAETAETTPASVEPAGDVAPAEEGKPVNETKAFSERLNTMSQKRVNDELDRFVAGMGLTNSYDNNKPITTKAEYDAYQAMKQLDSEGNTDPVSAYRANSIEGELQQLKDKNRDIELAADPQKGDVYKSVRDEVMELTEYCRSRGIQCTIDSAFDTLISQKFWDLREDQKNQAANDALRKINNNAQATPGALSGETPEDTADFAKMSDSEFDKYLQKALRGELRQS